MCLSTVYLDEKMDSTVAGTDVSELSNGDGKILIRTLFGEEKSFDGYAISEISLTENYVILRKEAKNV